jgi:hypothetical protein
MKSYQGLLWARYARNTHSQHAKYLHEDQGLEKDLFKKGCTLGHSHNRSNAYRDCELTAQISKVVQALRQPVEVSSQSTGLVTGIASGNAMVDVTCRC